MVNTESPLPLGPYMFVCGLRRGEIFSPFNFLGPV